MSSLRKIKKKKFKEEITEKAMDYTKFVLDGNEKTKVFSMMALSNLCKYYRNYFSIPDITDKNLVKGDTKISKLSEEQTLWCSFELEDIIQRSFRTLTRLIEEYDYEDLQNPNQRKIKDFKNEFVVVEFSKIYQKELINLKIKFDKYLKTRYKETENALKQILVIFAYYNIFKAQICNKIKDFNKKNRMYIKTLITKTDKKFTEIEEVVKEGGEINHEEEALSLLEFEEAGIEIKWIGYSRKEALKARKKYERISG